MRLSPAAACLLLALAATVAGCLEGQPAATADASPGPAGSGPAPEAEPRPQAAAGRPTPTPAPSAAPKPKDTDRDGASDRAEKENGTDPRDPEDVPYVLPPAPQVDAAALLADLRAFAAAHGDRSSNGADHLGARDWLASRFGDAGLEVWRQPFHNGIPQENVVGIRWGLDRNAWVAVGAHYDTTTTLGVDRSLSQGIYDDGSGTMMAAHLALAYANLTLPYTLAFVAFDGEERGLEGSAAFLSALLSGESPYPEAQLVGAVDLDMFGLNWPGTGAPMVFTTNAPELRDAVEAARLAQGVPEEGIAYDTGLVLGSSDYQSFFDHGIPTGFFLSDFEQLGAPMGLPASTPQGVYPFWHLADTWETMLLMAGDEAHLQAGFQAGVDLANALVHFLASGQGPVEAGSQAV